MLVKGRKKLMKKSKKQKNQKRKGKKKVINELASFGFLPSAPIHTWDWKGNESRLKERNISKTKGLFDNIFKINFWEQFLKNNSKLFWMKKILFISVYSLWKHNALMHNAKVPHHSPCFQLFLMTFYKNVQKHLKFVLKNQHILRTTSQNTIFIPKFVKCVFKFENCFFVLNLRNCYLS